MDCSGFACYYLEKIRKLKALKEIKDFVSKNKNIAEADIKRIYTKEFSVFFRQMDSDSKYWQVIVDPIELKKGDIIIFTSENPRENHTMIVNKILEQKENELKVAVFDSTKFPHINDTRIDNNTGIGQGEIVIFKDFGVEWNTFQRKNYKLNGCLDFGRVK